jgi:GTP-binding protein EngB required for normal cell division
MVRKYLTIGASYHVLFTKYDKVKEDQISKACSTHGRKGMRRGFWWESQKERQYKEDLRRK